MQLTIEICNVEIVRINRLNIQIYNFKVKKEIMSWNLEENLNMQLLRSLRLG